LSELIAERKVGTMPIYKVVHQDKPADREFAQKLRKMIEEQPKKKRLGTDVGVNIFDLLPEEDY
jgi:hypothetical protein